MMISLRRFIQYLYPQHTLTFLAGCLANWKNTRFKNWAIKYFIRKYQVDTRIAVSDNLNDYPTFNSFFIRRLKPEARPITSAKTHIASPVDGCVSQIGLIENGTIFQAKKYYFSLTSLLGGSQGLANQFNQGSFATFYLAPKDYHRVHMPYAGKLLKTIFVPGKLFSVSTYTTYTVPNLFARNERLICLFETDIGPMIVIFVGAMLVGSINTAWGTHYSFKKITEENYSNNLFLERGAELGHFELGSTVILLFPQNTIRWRRELTSEAKVIMGEMIAEIEKG